MNRLYLDIETSLAVMASFTLWPKMIPHDNILKDWHIICAAWMWEGETKAQGIATCNSNDKKVVKALRDVIIQADEIVYHNGRKFDYKKLNTRVLANNLSPMTKPREVDTLVQARKHFAFTSNRLDYIGKFLGVGEKMHTSSGLWLRALEKDKEAINEMLKYNLQDVILLEKVFKAMQPHIDVGYNKNIGLMSNNKCPKCESVNLQSRGWSVTKTARYQRYQCQNCGSWSQDGRRDKTNQPPVR